MIFARERRVNRFIHMSKVRSRFVRRWYDATEAYILGSVTGPKEKTGDQVDLDRPFVKGRKVLALSVLRRLTRALQSVLLALFHSSIACKQARFAESGSQRLIVLN